MYCPSCDKKYGAIHSRCPECHSWLKVSAPSGAGRPVTKSTTSQSVQASRQEGPVSTLERQEPAGSWGQSASPAGESGSWENKANDSWGDSSSSGSWGGASHGGASSGDSWGGASDDSWGSADDSWGGSAIGGEPPAVDSTPAPHSQAWLSDESSASLGGAATPKPDESLGGWGNPDPEPPRAQTPRSGSSSGGWLGDSVQEEPQPGWLTAGPGPEVKESKAGWLDQGPEEPSLTEMVDTAISAQDGDSFVDDSWVDEEMRDSEFDDFADSDYVPPSPELGGQLVKLALLTVLVLLVGGALFSLKGKKSEAQLAAEKMEKSLLVGRSNFQDGVKEIDAGRASNAVGLLELAMTSLSDGKAPTGEILEAEVALSQALMASEEYEAAFKHWKSLSKSGNKEYVKKGRDGAQSAARELRLQANESLKIARKQGEDGDTFSVTRAGEDAKLIYEKFGGNPSQIGNACGVIALGYFNRQEYQQAQKFFSKAVAKAPDAGYQKYLTEVNSKLAPTQRGFTPNPVQRQRYQAPRRAAPRRAAPRRTVRRAGGNLGGGSSYKTNNRRVGRRRGGGGRRAAPAASAPASSKRSGMKQIPIYRSSGSGGGRSRGRLGDKGVLKGY